MAWDRGVLVPTGRQFFGDVAIAALMAHEYGHAVQHMAGIVDDSTAVIVSEQQADCFAGTYVRWVAEGRSPRFSLRAGDGLNHVLAAAITLRDPILGPQDTEMLEEGHGTALTGSAHSRWDSSEARRNAQPSTSPRSRSDARSADGAAARPRATCRAARCPSTRTPSTP